ncbi:hypothetical protein GALL_294990 [mine drainage metagenome]|uniref:Transposase IS4-like domain-containing protein n=1 Tax=mine drainage metagenome TaxID=410659 RepID=A0A1J5R9B3_9ZZZZ
MVAAILGRPVVGLGGLFLLVVFGVIYTGTPANAGDVTQAHQLVHGEETEVFADAGYQGVDKREDTQAIDTQWHVAMRPGKRCLLDKTDPKDAIVEQLEHIKARIRAKMEHPFRVYQRVPRITALLI